MQNLLGEASLGTVWCNSWTLRFHKNPVSHLLNFGQRVQMVLAAVGVLFVYLDFDVQTCFILIILFRFGLCSLSICSFWILSPSTARVRLALWNTYFRLSFSFPRMTAASSRLMNRCNRSLPTPFQNFLRQSCQGFCKTCFLYLLPCEVGHYRPWLLQKFSISRCFCLRSHSYTFVFAVQDWRRPLCV